MQFDTAASLNNQPNQYHPHHVRIRWSNTANPARYNVITIIVIVMTTVATSARSRQMRTDIKKQLANERKGSTFRACVRYGDKFASLELSAKNANTRRLELLETNTSVLLC